MNRREPQPAASAGPQPSGMSVQRGRSSLRSQSVVLAILAMLPVAAACSAPLASVEVVPTVTEGQSARFRFALPDGNSVGNEELAGRKSVILFLTTFDTVSQAIARRLEELRHLQSPRINVLAVALEPPQNVTLVAVYRETLALSYPVALADAETLEGKGPLGDVRAVPSLMLLDEQSRVLSRGSGVQALATIESRLRELGGSTR